MTEPLSYLSVLTGAVLLDLLLGDPADHLHPVAWIGRAIGAASQWAPERPRGRLFFGSMMVLLGVISLGVLFFIFQKFVPTDTLVGWLLHVLLLKLSFSLKGLRKAVRRINDMLEEGDLEGARRRLGWDLVSRDTESLRPEQVAAATIESLAENLTDSFAAPLLAYALGGLPAAWAYRFVNTADAMVGYRTERYEFLGKGAALTDDWLNWLPARLSAAFILAGSAISRASLTGAWRALRSDRRATASPNAGWTMAAVGGALGLRLEKVGHYTLNRAGRLPVPSDLDRADRLMLVAAAIGLLAVGALGMVIRGL